MMYVIIAVVGTDTINVTTHANAATAPVDKEFDSEPSAPDPQVANFNTCRCYIARYLSAKDTSYYIYVYKVYLMLRINLSSQHVHT